MSEQFDPYRKWLGIPPAEQPANHYRLLGIAVFEEDPDVIAHAADRQMSHVRKFQSGQNGAHAQKLLSELVTARRCLLADAERKPYDEQLRKQLGVASSNGGAPVAAPQPARPVPAPAPTAAPEPPAPVAPPQQEPPVATAEVPKAQPIAVANSSGPTVAVRSRPVSSVARRGRRKNSAVPIIAALAALAGLACAVLIIAVAMTSETEDEPSAGTPHHVPTTPVEQPNTQPPKPPRQNNPPPRPPKEEPKPPIKRDPVMPEEISGRDGEEDRDVPAVAVDNPQRRAEFEQAVTTAETALGNRNMTTASEQIALADSLKFSTDETEQISNLQVAYDRLSQFWTAVDSGLKRLKSGDEIGFDGTISNFVSTQDESVTLLVTGNRKTERLTELSSSYLVAIAQRGLSNNDPVAKLVLATFLAIDQRDASPQQLEKARSLYADAVASGEICKFLAERLGTEDDAQSLPQPGDSGDSDPDAPEDSLDAPELPVDLPSVDGALPAPGNEPKVGPVTDAS